MKDFVKKHPRGIMGTLRLILLLTAVLLLFLACAIPGAAADPQTRNLELCRRRSAELEQQLEEFKGIDTSEGGAFSQAVISSVNRYRKQLLDLQSHPEVSLRSLEQEIDLAFLRGSTAGRLTWIYVTNAAVAQSETESRSFLLAYESLMSQLDATDTLTAASPTSFSRDLNVSIYSERIRSLAQAGDSLRVNAIVAGAVEEVRGLLSGDLAGEPYASILENAKNEVALQRHRDALYADFLLFYQRVAPGANAESDEVTSLLLYRLTQNASLSDMNASVKLAADVLLGRFESDTHKQTYIATVKEQISREIASAAGVGRRACVSALVTDFSLRYLIADTKDQVENAAASSAYAPSDQLTRLMSEYVATGGILDGCATENDLAFELWRAKLRIGWWEELCAAKLRISSLLAPHDTATMHKKADAEWSAIDTRICAIPRNTATAETDCLNALGGGRAALSALLPEAEAEKFRLDHIGTIEKAQSALRSEDREVMIIAISAWNDLSSEAKERLHAEAGKLRENYRAVIRLCLLDTLRQDKALAMRKSSADKLCEKLLTLNITHLYDFGRAANGLLLQGESIALLLDRYQEIVTDHDYDKYDENYKTKLSAVGESACVSILSLTVLGDEPTAELTALLERGILNLVKERALAQINLAAEHSSLPEVVSAVKIAEARIGAATSEESVVALTEACVLSVRKAILEEKAPLFSAEVIRALHSLPFLTEKQKLDFAAAIEQKAQEIAAEIPLAADLSQLNLAYTAYTISCEGILAQAEALNLSKCKEDAAQKLLDIIAKAKEALRALPEPEDEIKATFLEALDALQAEILAKIHLAEGQAEVDSLLAEAKIQAEAQVTDARLYKIRLYRKELLDGLEKEFGSSLHYSAENYKSIRALMDQFKAELEARDTSDEYELLLKNTKDKLTAIPTLLEEAKQTAAIQLREFYDALLSRSAAYSEANLARLSDLMSQAAASIEEITEILDYQSVYLCCQEAISAMKAVPMDRVYNGPASIQGSLYPDGFDAGRDGLWGVVTAPGGIPSDSRLSVSLRPVSTDDYYKLMQEAIDQGSLLHHGGDAVSLSLRRQLKRADLLLCADIRTVLPTQGGPYRVELLLPEGYDTDRLLGVVWFGTDGSAEYYNAEITNSVLSFEASHFSSFYIVTKSRMNLLPIIIFISLLILAEMVLLAFLLYRRYRRSHEGEERIEQEPPALPFSGFVAPLAFFGRGVKSDLPLVAVLSGVAILLGLADLYLIREELALIRSQKKTSIIRPKEASAPMLASAKRMALPTVKAMVSVSSVKGGSTVVEEEAPPPSTDTEEPLETVEKEVCAELNLDTLSRHFQAGDCVTPELLKQMELIPGDTTHLKILARGHLSIPLFISAQEFSNAALRAIKKAGGKAFKIE